MHAAARPAESHLEAALHRGQNKRQSLVARRAGKLITKELTGALRWAALSHSPPLGDQDACQCYTSARCAALCHMSGA